MLHLAVRMAGRRVAALVAVALAVLGGAALVTATGVLAESGLRSCVPAGRVAGADVLVSADQTVRPAEDLPIALPERAPVPAALVARLARVPGVRAAVGDVSFPAALVDARGRVVVQQDPQIGGHGWSSARLLAGARVDGVPPVGPSQVAVGSRLAAAAGLHPGSTVRVVVAGAGGAGAEHRVSAVVSTDGATATDGAGILFADPTAAHLAGRDRGPRAGTVDLVGLRVAPGARARVAAAVRHQLPGSGFTVATGAARGEAAVPAATAARSLLVVVAGSLSGTTLLIVGFVVAGALGACVEGQRRELALLRAVGATPRQVRRLAVAQAALPAAAAAGPGVALGHLLAEQFRRLLVGVGLLPGALPLTLGPLPALVAVLLLALVVQVAAQAASWRTSRLPATEAVAGSRAGRRPPSRIRTQAGLLLVVAATALSVGPLLARTQLGAAATSLAGILAGVGLALAGPALLRRGSAALVRALPQRASACTWLAVSGTSGYAARTAGVVSALAMTVLFVLTHTLAQTTVLRAVSDDVRTGTLAGSVIAAPALGGVPTDVLPAVRAVPGVRAAAPVSSTTVLWTHHELGDATVEADPATVLTPDAPGVLDLGVRAGDLRDLTGATIAVGSDVARSDAAGLGARVHLVLGDGTPVDARVVAVYDRDLGFGPLVVSRDLVAGHTTTGLDQRILVRTGPSTGTTTGTTTGTALAALVASRPGLALAGTAPGSGALRSAPPQVWVNLATLVVLLGYVLLGTTNKLVATTAQRRTEIATLQVVGATPRQVLAVVRREAALLTAAAVGAGLLLSAVPLVLLGLGFLGRPWPAGPVWLLPASALVVAAIALGTSELPTRRALRTPPAQVLGSGG